ncbi:GAF domain-containing protein [Streptomyces sp. NPDC052114]|uniref:GAF domain-containing protein n=1 Tax=unclassified Streptomyces TaxID=2593676 RepID=UPI003421D1ED
MAQSWSVSGVEVSVSSRPERTIVHVAGKLHHSAVVALRRQLSPLSDHGYCLVLDFSRVSFLGFAGVELVEAMAEQVRSAGGEMEVWGASDPRLRALHLRGGLRALRLKDGDGTPSAAAAQGRNERVLREALATALRATGAPMGNAQILDTASTGLHIAVQRGFRQPFLSFFRHVEVGGGNGGEATGSGREAIGHGSSCGLAAQRQSPIFVEDVRASPLFVGTTALDVLQDAGVRAVASLPVVNAAQELTGMISTHHARPMAWTPEVREELRHVARAAGQLAQ